MFLSFGRYSISNIGFVNTLWRLHFYMRLGSFFLHTVKWFQVLLYKSHIAVIYKRFFGRFSNLVGTCYIQVSVIKFLVVFHATVKSS